MAQFLPSVYITHDGNTAAQHLRIVDFVVWATPYRPSLNYRQSLEAIRDEAIGATNYMNDHIAEGNNYWGWKGNQWGYFTSDTAPPPSPSEPHA